ncbi:MAG: DUF374 domain-containing protein [Candidatus Krumholzibacteria bacterium]|nr:DUF374 domain-containing protein [Candidatus Krumholzibacteria bacterium]
MSLQRWKLALAPVVWHFLKSTVSVGEFVPRGNLGNGPVIFACLHRDILPAIMYVRGVRPALLVSDSPDGDILVKTLGRRDYRIVRGATGGDGRRALVLLRRELEAGHSVGLAVDGPEGPFGSIREGVLHLARMTGAPVAPLVARASHPLVLNTWDRTVVPIPFRKVEVDIGPVIWISQDSRDVDMKKHLAGLAEFFDVAEEG